MGDVISNMMTVINKFYFKKASVEMKLLSENQELISTSKRL